MKKIILFIILAILGIGSAAQFFYYSEKQPIAPSEEEQPSSSNLVKLSEDQIKAMDLAFETASPGEMTLHLTMNGKIVIDPDKLAHILPKVTGIAREAKKNVGSAVKSGEVIAVLESQELAELKAAFLAAIFKEKLAKNMLNREEILFQKHISPLEDYLKAQNALNEAALNKELISQKLKVFGQIPQDIAERENLELGKYEIFSPMDGTVLMRHITQGELIDEHALIYEIADLSSVLVEAAVYPKDLSRIQEGQKVEVINLEDASSSEGTLIYLSPTIANENLATKALAKLDNLQGKWRPGQFVKVKIATDQISSPLVINKSSIQKIDGCDCAFVYTDKGFEKREIRLGKTDQKVVEVLSGLDPGEKYVSKNPFLLKAELNKDEAKDED